jgi:type I restriction enzyme M protein
MTTPVATAREQDIRLFVDALDYKEQPLVLTTEKEMYRLAAEQETLVNKVFYKPD